MKPPDINLRGVRVLCADDCPEVLEFLHFFLTGLGAEVTTCDSAEKAIHALKTGHFEVLISDLNMPPGLDGYDLVHALRGMEGKNPGRKATPSIMISGNALQPSRKRRFADFQVYMSKPVDSKRLAYVVDRLVEADSEAVTLGSLEGWEAQQAIDAAMQATKVAEEATAAAADATSAAKDATAAASRAKTVASKAEAEAKDASSKAPPENPC